MNRRMQWIAGLVLLVLSATASAQTPNYNYLGYKMLNTRDYPFRYYLDARTNNSGIAITEVEKATTAAFKTWEDASCAYPAFLYMGQSTTNSQIDPTNPGNPYDAFNVSTVWVSSSSDKYYTLALEGGQALTGSIALSYAGYLYQCDIFVNGVTARWTTLPNTPASEGLFDLQSMLTHEVGHCLGLGDMYFPETAVMDTHFPVGGSRRVLDAQDVGQICNYYPEDGAVGSPCSTSDPCINGLSCIPFKDSNGITLYNYCSKGCPGLTNGECPSPFVCQNYALDAGVSKACLAVPGSAVTQVGKPCNNTLDAGVECGSPRSVCQGPVGLPSGNTAWVEGYCQEGCVAGSSANTCPAGSVCVELGTDDRCLKPCRPGAGDCRQGYTCSPLPEGNVCVPNCYQDVDCNAPNSSAYTCRVCDRVCIENKAAGGSVGAPCTDKASRDCGSGLICLFINNNPQGVCAQPCSTAQCDCPNGSSCKTVGPDRVCMKNCAAGTCAAPLQCNPVGQSLSCTPACTKKADCPTGFECYGGRCENPDNTPDAGCTLCNDAGNPPPPPPPTDGGTGGGTGGPSGCGCGQAPASALVLLGTLALVLFSRRRNAWPRR